MKCAISNYYFDFRDWENHVIHKHIFGSLHGAHLGSVETLLFEAELKL